MLGRSVAQRRRAASRSVSRPISMARSEQASCELKPAASAAVLTMAFAVSQELMRALLIQVSRPLAHLVSPPSSGETDSSASWKAMPGSAAVMLRSMFLNSAAEMCEKEPPNTSMPPQPARALGNWIAASW